MATNKLDDGGGTIVTPPPAPPGFQDPGVTWTPGPSADPGADPYAPSAGAQGPTAPAPGPDTITTTPGYTPDYNAAITNDPGYVAATAANAKAKAQAEAARQAAVRAAYIKYGGDQSGFKDAYGDIDQATRDAAKANQYSTLAGLKQNYDQSVEQFRRALAARGALQSGDLNYGQSQMDRGYGQAQYDAGNQFGADYANSINQYTGVLDQNDQNMVSAINGAEANAYSDPANHPTAAKTAARDAGLSSQYGQDIYKGDDGTYYTRDGSVFIAPSASPNGDPYASGYGPYSWGLGGKT